MKHAIYVPPFDALADPIVLAGLGVVAEESGWDGLFLWDHVSYRNVEAIADPWISLAAVACATEGLRLGPMVTPLARRRPVQVAREVATLDLLTDGRVTLGVGLGDDHAGELSGTGEEVDAKARAALLDESLEILLAAWTGDEVRHRGRLVLDGIAVRPRPVQQPHPPVWTAVVAGNRKPLRRAARYDGVFPVGIDSPETLRSVVDQVGELRGGLDGYDVAVALNPDTDPAP
ncbi:MAG: LLM class flavin-dependent oxidoreductase, partial [Nocardioidaceae bacterium]|nr:LLM class flavin-dependent oxidoreductase [Nocardioidaceae bacterium]